jgi:hypothetical protein
MNRHSEIIHTGAVSIETYVDDFEPFHRHPGQPDIAC